jgi:NhaA family Na+:H+ antiporter
MTDRHDHPSGTSTGARPTWSRSSRLVARLVARPVRSFLETETASAVLLLLAAAAALVWANSPAGATYDRSWGTELAIRIGRWTTHHDLRAWVADGLMTLFFFVAGLEIKRELLAGALRQPGSRMLPVVAAAGGMVLPAAIYLAFTAGTAAAPGFGIAMPTDVVFALGVLALARGTPKGAKTLLLALALVDDLASIVVVAFATPTTIAWEPLLLAAVALALYGLLWRIHVRAVVVYIALGGLAWVACWASGISPTLAGVAVALLTPAVPFQPASTARGEARRVADLAVDEPFTRDADATRWLDLGRLSREAVSPLARAEAVVLPWSSYLIVPLFALAFAGVDVSAGAISQTASTRVGLAIVVARVIGKPLGIVGAALVAVRLGARLPSDIGHRDLLGIGIVAAIPFTISLYLAERTLPRDLIEPAIIAILVSGIIAGALGLVVLRRDPRRPG